MSAYSCTRTFRKPARLSSRFAVSSEITPRASRRGGISRYSSTASWNSPARMWPPASKSLGGDVEAVRHRPLEHQVLLEAIHGHREPRPEASNRFADLEELPANDFSADGHGEPRSAHTGTPAASSGDVPYPRSGRRSAPRSARARPRRDTRGRSRSRRLRGPGGGARRSGRPDRRLDPRPPRDRP